MEFLFDTPTATAIGSILLGVKMLASAITSLTPTPKDDKIVSKVYKVVELFAGIWSSKAKQ